MRVVTMAGINPGIAVPAFSAALVSYDGLRTKRLPANWIHAQRDYSALTPANEWMNAA